MAPHDRTRLGFAQADAMVRAIWADLGLAYPPAVERLPRQSRRTLARGDRLSLALPETFPSWWLLHELAHALSSTAEGAADGHGPVFVGLYVQLLERYLRLDRRALVSSLGRAGIRVAVDARPVFLSAE